MNNNWLAGTSLAVIALFATVGAFAHGGATGIVKERMDLMDRLGKDMKALTQIMRGKEEYNPDKVRALAKSIGEHGGDAMTKLFPEGSDQSPTVALPSIWTDWNRFSELANSLSGYAMALEKSAENERPSQSSGMMSDGGMMSGEDTMGGGMMSSAEPVRPTPESLIGMPPDAAFLQLAGTCSSCHQGFRKEKK